MLSASPHASSPPGSSWAGGNLAGVAVGNVLIIQESATAGEIAANAMTWSSGLSSQGPGWAPDDEGGGGSIAFIFESALDSFEFDFVDVDSPVGYTIDFTDTSSTETISLLFSDFENPASTFYDFSVAWGDSTANHLQPITPSDLVAEYGGSLTQFDQITFNLNGSGGVASIGYTVPAQVPEPSTGLLLAMGLVFIAAWRTRRPRGVR